MSQMAPDFLFALIQKNFQITDLSNPYVQPRVLRIIGNCRLELSRYLDGVSYEQFSAGLADLQFIVQRGRASLQGEGELVIVDGDEIFVAYCDFIVLRHVFEQRMDLIADMQVQSNFSLNKFYILLALFEFGRGFDSLLRYRESKDESGLAATISLGAVTFILAAYEITSFVSAKYQNETKAVLIEELTSILNRTKQQRKDIGSKPPKRLEQFHLDCKQFAEQKWNEELAEYKLSAFPQIKNITRLGHMVNKLYREAQDKQLKITKKTIREQLKKAKIVPDEAIRSGA